MYSHSFVAITPRFVLTGVVALVRVPFVGQIYLFEVMICLNNQDSCEDVFCTDYNWRP